MKENEKTGSVTLRHRCDCGTIHIIDLSKRQLDVLRKVANSRPRKAQKLLEGFSYTPKLVSPENVKKILDHAKEAGTIA